MTNSLGIVKIPSRFEALRDAVGVERISQVLIEPTQDLLAMKQITAELRSSGQGKLVFLLGLTGAGKTSLAEALSIFMADAVSNVLTPPPDYSLSLDQLASWIANALNDPNISSKKGITVINLDGREMPVVNEAVTNGAMVNINALLRRTPSLLLVWPIIQRNFAEDAIRRLLILGGQSALARTPIYEVQGIDKSRYFDALKLLLDITSLKLQDAAISDEEARDIVAQSSTIGDYLTKIQSLVVDRYDLGELGVRLPKISICITSNVDTTPICRMLRRGSTFYADPDRILQFSRSNIAEDWRRRGKENPRRAFAFISSLFELKIVNASSSAVVNCCALSNDRELRKAIKKHYPNPVSSNAGNSLGKTSLYRSLANAEDVGKGNPAPSDPIKNAYAAIQALSATKHAEINRSIVDVLVSQLGLNLGELRFEHLPFADKGLRADVWFQRDMRPETIEFTHRDDQHSSEAVLSSYILAKMQDYARDYGLI